ncbi:MAG: hypothetical protein ACYCPN_05250 [Thermoplasmata archaeon]
MTSPQPMSIRMPVPRRATAALTLAVVSVVVVALLASSIPVSFPADSAMAGAGSAVTSSGSTSLSISVSNAFAFTPSAVGNLAPNSTITFTMTTLGSLAHTFTLVNASNQGYNIASLAGGNPSAVTAGQLSSFFAKYPPLVNALFPSTITSKVINFTSPPKGWYEFVCLEPGHYQSGMFGFLAFGMAVPSNISGATVNTGPGLPVFIITGTIVTLVVIAVVLAFVVGRRRQGEEMPPERLGYPEPPVEPPAPHGETPPSTK